MTSANQETRDKVRALVREVLRTVPVEIAANEPEPELLLVNSLKARSGREFDRDESSKMLLTEDDLRGLDEGARLRVAENAKFTPLARDIIAEKHIALVVKEARQVGIRVRSVAIGSDHGGFPLKEQLKDLLGGLGLSVRDYGTNSTDAVDYPDFAHAVAKAVSGKQADVGILIDGAGIGSAIAANKVPGVRAAACYSPALARNSREHNGANVLTLGSGQSSYDEAKAIVEAFMTTEISEDRHKKRVEKINSIDRSYRA